MLRFQGAEHFRQRLVFSTLSGRPIRIDGIRPHAESPGLQEHEASLLRLIEKVTNGCIIEINETGEVAWCFMRLNCIGYAGQQVLALEGMGPEECPSGCAGL